MGIDKYEALIILGYIVVAPLLLWLLVKVHTWSSKGKM